MIASENDQEVSVETSLGAEFIEWTLAEGETVVFDLKKLVAFSQSVKLRRRISFRLSSMLFSKILFSVADGPGTLVFRTTGNAEAINGDAAGLSVASIRYIAWNEDAKFFINASSKYRDIYGTGSHIGIEEGYRAIIDVPRDEDDSGGAAKFILPLFLPT